ncbi:helix-turn-helix domain-containing protein [Lacihabitans soyangensis]|uniref:XRE family transcriptional regulator n=1 Tax=Lacihabitans soyangensis TaxID=869394 RepID=A0AAE3GZB7_9BACT|nr:helix-turn-helix transcriptional regulator [Lacihabitans soyangensis]MCP9762032.1 XRE family transcriptional regulator [Lacihabitans soyangensis]
MPLVNENIKVLRKRMGMTQEKFAEVLGIKRSLIGAYEENRAVPPAENLNKISRVFGITLDQLINYSYEREFNKRPDAGSFNSDSKEEAPFPIEKRTAFQHTNREIPSVQPSLFEPVKSVSVSTFPAKEKGIKYINANLFEKYLSGETFEQFAENLPSISLPFFTQENLRAFDAPVDFPLENCILIAEKVSDFNQIVEGENHLLISRLYGFKYRRLYNQIHIKGVLLTSSDKANTQSQEIKASEIKEIWKPISYISKAMPLPDISLESIQDKVDSLKTELDFLLSFRAKK